MNKLIYLYIKESPGGLKYLGITSEDNPYSYRGSGKHWKRHLKKHNIRSKDIKTTILLKTEDRSIITFWGLYYSKIWNIVESEEWANLIPESGELRVLGVKLSEDRKNRLRECALKRTATPEFKAWASKLHKGKKISEEDRKKMSNAKLGVKHSKERAISGGLARLKKVYQYDLDWNFIREWNGVLVASKALNINRGNISLCCHNKGQTAGGFKWSYTIK